MNFNVVHRWLPLAFIATALSGLIYLSVQQVLRQSANDPQIQLAEDLAARLIQGQPVSSLVQLAPVDMATSLAPFVIVYDEQGKVLGGSGQLGGTAPQVPAGVLAAARARGENRLTWQPKPGVRNAIVVTHFSSQTQSGFVLVGRSLREVEIREQQLETDAFLVWLVTLVGVYFVIAVSTKKTTAALA